MLIVIWYFGIMLSACQRLDSIVDLVLCHLVLCHLSVLRLAPCSRKDPVQDEPPAEEHRRRCAMRAVQPRG